MSKEDRLKMLSITADRYKSLIAAWHELMAIKLGGANNWQACQDYIQEYVDNHPLFLGHIGHTDYVLDDIDFNTIAEYETEMLIELEEEENAST